MKLWGRKIAKQESDKREEKRQQYRDLTSQVIDDLIAFRGVGEKFNYLGAEMIVTGHSEIKLGCMSIDLVPVLICDYRDNNGILRQCKFRPREIPTLRRENENNHRD